MNRNLFALAAIMAGLAPQVAKADNSQCQLGNAVMSRTYIASGTGTVAGLGPIAIVGEVVYNGDGPGNVVLLTQVVNGTNSTFTNIPATFTVNRDCTGTKVIGTTHYNFVISANGSVITFIVTDSGVTLMGTGVRLKK